MTAPGIVVEGVRRSFGTVAAVQDATFTARAGAVTALVGPNGSGKTTLLLMLASLLAPDAGRIAVDGIDPVVDPHAARARLGWMPDALGAWGALTVRETVRTAARLYDMSPPVAASRASELVDLVGLTDLADRPARVLSRGQKQRLGLARALVNEPAVLLLDEPASGLDPQARVELRELLRALAAEGRTVLLSSHILSELDEVADDAVFLRAGRTVDRPSAPRARLWRVRLDGVDPSTSAARVGDALARDAAVSRRDAVVTFESDADAADALAALVGAGLRVVEFAPVSGDLERTYLDLEHGA